MYLKYFSTNSVKIEFRRHRETNEPMPQYRILYKFMQLYYCMI